jgi:hypothetical protein
MKFKDALATVRKHGFSLVAEKSHNVRLVAVGRKETGALAGATQFCVTAYVDQKLTSKQMKARGIEAFDSVYSAVLEKKKPSKTEIDVVESPGAFRPRAGLKVPQAQRGLYGGNPPVLNAQKPFDALRCGIGITNPTGEYPGRISVGTAGFYMEDDNGNLYVVSNNHVIGRANDAVPGESIVQPGTLDLTSIELQLMPTLSSLVATLEIASVLATVPLQFMTAANTPSNRVDAAIGQLLQTNRTLDDLDRLTFGGVIRSTASPYTVDSSGALQGSTRVYKVGRTTGYTEGNVTGLAGVSTISYDDSSSDKDAHFVDQIVVEATQDNVGPFSDSGDSGSGVENDRHELAGLLFAGNNFHTLVNPIADVMSELRTATGIPSLRVITG